MKIFPYLPIMSTFQLYVFPLYNKHFYQKKEDKGFIYEEDIILLSFLWNSFMLLNWQEI